MLGKTSFNSFQPNFRRILRNVKLCPLPLLFGGGIGTPCSRAARVQSTAAWQGDHARHRGLPSEAAALHRTVGDIPTLQGVRLPLRYARSLFGLDRRFHYSLEEAFQSTGSKLFRFRIPFVNQTLLVTADPDHVATVFRHESRTPVRTGGEDLVEFMKQRGYDSGLLAENSDNWKALRSKSNKQIVPRRVLEYTPLIHEVAEDVVEHFRKNRGVNNYVEDVISPLMQWAFEGIGIFIIGERLNSFTDATERFDRFAKAGVNYIAYLGPMLSPIPWYKFVTTRTSILFVDCVRELDESIKEMVDDKITKLSGSNSNEAVGFLEQWLLDDRFTLNDMCVLVRDFLAAGIDTTSTLGTYILYELAKNPQVQEKLREEVLSVVGEHQVPTVEHLQQLQYCKNVINETMRYHPVTVGTARVLSEDIVFDDYHIPKDNMVFMAGYSMSRDSSIFEDPHTFNPDRWTRESKKKNAFAHLPFGLGTRGCYGRRLAELELNLLLIQMSRHFTLSTDMAHLDTGGTTVLKPSTPVRIQFNDRC